LKIELPEKGSIKLLYKKRLDNYLKDRIGGINKDWD
jgi:hypothetical protein